MMRIARASGVTLGLLLAVASAHTGELKIPAVPDGKIDGLVQVAAPSAYCAAVSDVSNVFAVDHKFGKEPHLSLFALDAVGQPTKAAPVPLMLPRPAGLTRKNYPTGLAFHPKLPLIYVWQDVESDKPGTPPDPAAKDFDHLLIYNVSKSPPALVQAIARGPEYAIGNRAGAILVPAGLGTALSGEPYHPQGKHVVGESARRLGVNLVAYVLGSTEYGKFLAQEFPVYKGRTRAGDVVRFAPLRYRGSWDVNPALQNTLLQELKEYTNIDVDYAPKPVAFDDAELGNYPLVFMTGHYDFKLTPAEAEGMARYLQRGGMLVATAAAGLKPFDHAFRRELKKALPNADLVKLPPTHPLFVGGWSSVEKIAYTPSALKDDPTLEFPEFYGLFLDGRLASATSAPPHAPSGGSSSAPSPRRETSNSPRA